jgi:hypothetical protein
LIVSFKDKKENPNPRINRFSKPDGFLEPFHPLTLVLSQLPLLIALNFSYDFNRVNNYSDACKLS